jgi:nitric oxide synthase-interacting protein
MEYDGRKVTGVIKLQKGGSGYAGSGTQVESKAYNMLGTGSGLADSRGQKRGGASRFGLKFN